MTRTRRSPALIAGLAVAVALTLYAAVQVIQWTSESRTETKTFVIAQQVQNVDIHTSGDVRVEPTTADRVTIESRRSGSVELPDVTPHVSSGTVKIDAGCGFPWSNCDASFVVHVPAGTNVNASSDSGDLSARGAAGNVSLHSDSGDITADAVAGNVSLTTDSGSIAATRLRAPNADAHTDSGDVTLAFLLSPPNVNASSDSGDVSVELPRTPDAYKVEHSTDSGSDHVAVRTDPLATRTIAVHTDSGDVSVRYAH